MSDPPRDPALDALLAEYAAPPAPAGLAARATAAALAHPQAPAPPHWRAARDRRGGWLRRPLLVGGAALGLAFSGAVASTYAGVELPRPVQAVIDKLPFVARKAPDSPIDAQADAPGREPRERAVSPATPAQQERPFATFWRSLTPDQQERLRQAPALQRLVVAKQIVDARRAAGLPTPRADIIERAIERRRAAATAGEPLPPRPGQALRAQRRERIREAIEARRAETQTAPVSENAAPLAEPLVQFDEVRTERFERRRELRQERIRRWIERRQQMQSEGNVAAPRYEEREAPPPSAPSEGE